MRGVATILRALQNAVSAEPAAAPAQFAVRLPSLLHQLRDFKQQANEVRPGQVMDLKGRLLQVSKFQHTQGSGRQLGNVQLELKDIKSGAKHQQRYRSYDTVELVRLDEKLYKYLYTEGTQLHFMDPATYEQEAVDVEAFGEQHDFLVEDMEVTLSFHEGEVISGSLPSQVKLNVISTDAILKGNQAAPQSKPAIVGSGRKIMVPQFVAPGECIVVDTKSATFVKRAK